MLVIICSCLLSESVVVFFCRFVVFSYYCNDASIIACIIITHRFGLCFMFVGSRYWLLFVAAWWRWWRRRGCRWRWWRWCGMQVTVVTTVWDAGDGGDGGDTWGVTRWMDGFINSQVMSVISNFKENWPMFGMSISNRPFAQTSKKVDFKSTFCTDFQKSRFQINLLHSDLIMVITYGCGIIWDRSITY